MRLYRLGHDGYRDVGELNQLGDHTAEDQRRDASLADPPHHDLIRTLLLGDLKQDVGHLTMAYDAGNLDTFG